MGGGAVPGVGAFSVGGVAANAPPVIAKDTPAAPNTGKAVLERFRFDARFIVDLPYLGTNAA